MVHNAPGKAYREGITLLQLADRFPTEESAVQWFEGVVWSGEAGLRALRLSRHVRDQERQAHAVSVPRLQAVLQRENGNAHGVVASSRPQVGLRDLSGRDEPQGCCVDEAATAT